MLKGVPEILSPEILKVLAEMGHQDKLVLCDANFPAERYKKYGAIVLRADGIKIPQLLDAVLSLFPLDTYVKTPVTLMEVPADQHVETPIWDEYRQIVAKYDKRGVEAVGTMERMAFYLCCRDAYLLIQTGETAGYANVMLDKGCI